MKNYNSPFNKLANSNQTPSVTESNGHASPFHRVPEQQILQAEAAMTSSSPFHHMSEVQMTQVGANMTFAVPAAPLPFLVNMPTEEQRSLSPLQLFGTQIPLNADACKNDPDAVRALINKLAANGMVLRHGNMFYWYTGHHYTPMDNRDRCLNELSQIFTCSKLYPESSDVNGALDQLKKLATPWDYPPNDEGYILYHNCIMDVQQNQPLPISPKYFFIGGVEANFNPNIRFRHPLMDQFLQQCTGNNPVLIRRIWELIGYCLSGDSHAKRIFYLIGVSDSGKSVLLKLIKKLLSPCLTNAMSLKNITGSRFALSELMDKQVCMSFDESNLSLSQQDIATLKRLSGGEDCITADVKNKSQVTFVARAKLVIASNYTLRAVYAANDPAFQRRLMIIPFNFATPKLEQDQKLLSKLLEERDAIATDAYFYYQELRRNGYVFSGDDKAYESTSIFLPGELPYEKMGSFVENYCVFGAEYSTPTRQLYDCFCRVYSDAEYKDITAFSRAFSTYCHNKDIVSTRKRYPMGNCNGFDGVGLKEIETV